MPCIQDDHGGPSGSELNDRPHTISTAYEKGHQRPPLQPYTFTPPESTLTIPECDTEGMPMVDHQRRSQDLPPPPPPKPPAYARPGSSASNASSDHNNFRPPSLPGKSSLAATMAATKQQMMLQQYNQAHVLQQGRNDLRTSLPDFSLNKDDMSKCKAFHFNESQ